MNLFDELQDRVVCGDGAMGTLLLDQGLPMESCLEEVCISDPDRVRANHRLASLSAQLSRLPVG